MIEEIRYGLLCRVKHAGWNRVINTEDNIARLTSVIAAYANCSVGLVEFNYNQVENQCFGGLYGDAGFVFLAMARLPLQEIHEPVDYPGVGPLTTSLVSAENLLTAVICHEIAHVVHPFDDHGSRWQETYRDLRQHFVGT
jgi:hypothetical protein